MTLIKLSSISQWSTDSDTFSNCLIRPTAEHLIHVHLHSISNEFNKIPSSNSNSITVNWIHFLTMFLGELFLPSHIKLSFKLSLTNISKHPPVDNIWHSLPRWAPQQAPNTLNILQHNYDAFHTKPKQLGRFHIQQWVSPEQLVWQNAAHSHTSLVHLHRWFTQVAFTIPCCSVFTPKDNRSGFHRCLILN